MPEGPYVASENALGRRARAKRDCSRSHVCSDQCVTQSFLNVRRCGGAGENPPSDRQPPPLKLLRAKGILSDFCPPPLVELRRGKQITFREDDCTARKGKENGFDQVDKLTNARLFLAPLVASLDRRRPVPTLVPVGRYPALLWAYQTAP